MKAITLTQPWATLVAIGAKQVETRSWTTQYRGPLAIHAAKGFPKSAKRLVTDDWAFFSALNPQYVQADWVGGKRVVPPNAGRIVVAGLPVGYIVAICKLIDMIPTEVFNAFPGSISAQERAFGDYSPGRFAWVLEDIEELVPPVEAKGALGLWNWTR